MPRNDKNQAFFCAENVENHAFCCAKNVENHAIFVEGFWPDFYARGRFMKYSMSGWASIYTGFQKSEKWVPFGITL